MSFQKILRLLNEGDGEKALADILEKILNNQKAIMDASGVDYA